MLINNNSFSFTMYDPTPLELALTDRLFDLGLEFSEPKYLLENAFEDYLSNVGVGETFKDVFGESRTQEVRNLRTENGVVLSEFSLIERKAEFPAMTLSYGIIAYEDKIFLGKTESKTKTLCEEIATNRIFKYENICIEPHDSDKDMSIIQYAHNRVIFDNREEIHFFSNLGGQIVSPREFAKEIMQYIQQNRD